MAKQITTDLEVRALRHGGSSVARPVRYRAGPGLYIQVAPPPQNPATKEAAKGSKSWVFRFMLAGKSREMGLGPYPSVTLAAALKAAEEAKDLLRQGTDPIVHAAEAKARSAAEKVAEARAAADAEEAREAAERAATADPFREVAAAYLALHEADWKNPKHAAQWKSTLATYAYPVLGDMPVAKITRADVLAVLTPIWKTKAETARRVRSRIEAVLEHAVGHQLRPEGQNPAALAVLGRTLNGKAKAKKREVRHHPSLERQHLPALMADLAGRDGVGTRALHFTILTAARSGEVFGARWEEIDEAAALWTIPKERMKAGREHRVPLSAEALAVLETMKPLAKGPKSHVFPGEKKGKPLSVMTMDMQLRRMGPDPEDKTQRWTDRHGETITVHGFRSTFRDWVSEATSYPHEVAEMALAHTIDSKTEAAYRRGDLLEKRVAMMSDWAVFCTRPAAAAKVVPIRQAG